MARLNVSARDWQQAKLFFKNFPDSIKYSRKSTGLPYSFIKVDGTIYAFGSYLGQGGCGIVKVAVNERGEEFALKIEGHVYREGDKKEDEILKLLGEGFGHVEIFSEKDKLFFKKQDNEYKTPVKLYKVLKLLEGNDLLDEVYNVDLKTHAGIHKNTLNYTQKLILAIKLCQALKDLQRYRIVHRDIKPENIKSIIQGNNIKVRYMDFGLVVILPPGQHVYTENFAGTYFYMAPEVFDPNDPASSKKLNSFASDVYSLGMLFNDDLQLPAYLHEPMIKADPRAHVNLDGMIRILAAELRRQPGLGREAQAVIAGIDVRPLPHPPLKFAAVSLVENKAPLVIKEAPPVIESLVRDRRRVLGVQVMPHQLPTRNLKPAQGAIIQPPAQMAVAPIHLVSKQFLHSPTHLLNQSLRLLFYLMLKCLLKRLHSPPFFPHAH